MALCVARILAGAFGRARAARGVDIGAEGAGAAGGITDLARVGRVDGSACDAAVADDAALAAALSGGFVAREIGSAVAIADGDALATLALVPHGAEGPVVAGGGVGGDAG